ncbi:MAG: chromosome condensation regulator [Hyperionvirus sp.]|uniref:Chromosome condensation regulator n=1 Tax=Hyperionvirus sp. TaxID=2487770 RepID=A0A3G5ABR3_9VIRU|nr:MAG: chromosome condensation regulator [Hyperionvirus sp.]
MDLIFLQTLPLDLLYIVANYNPAALFIYSKEELLRFNWTRLLRFNFHQDYKNSFLTNEELLRIYTYNFLGINKIICGSKECFIINDDLNVMNYDLRCRDTHEKYSHLLSVRDTPTFDIKDFQKNIFQVAYGNEYIIILLFDGTLLCRGNNVYGQLGLGDFNPRYTFVKNDTLGKDISIKQIVCGSYHTFILLTDGTLLGCGSNENGQLGLGISGSQKFFARVDGIKDIALVASGYYHSFIKLYDGTVMGCGNNTSGQLGFGDKRIVKTFTKIEYISQNIADIVCGNCTSFMLMNDGTLMSCGYGASGVLGHGNYKSKDIFTPVEKLPKNIVKIQAGFDHAICLLENGTIMTSGSNQSGELGFERTPKINIFQEIKNLPAKVINIGTGPFAQYSIIRLLNGTIMRYGACIQGLNSIHPN